MTGVLVLDEIHEDGIALLRGRKDIELTHLPSPTPEEVADGLAGAEALLIRGRVIDPEIYRSSAPSLKLVSRHGVGCDNLPLALLEEKGVKVAIAAAANANSVAEHTMMLMLAVAKNVIGVDAAVRGGEFGARDRGGTVELAGRTLLVVGMGRIGREVAVRARAFGMHVVGYDTAYSTPNFVAGTELVEDLDAALGKADFVTIHVPLTGGNRGMFDAGRIAHFKEGSFLINTARGGIVDEKALRAALESGRLAGAGLDVFENEPLPADDPLLGAPNVVATPHNAAMTFEGARRMSTHAAQAILDFIDGHHDRITFFA